MITLFSISGGGVAMLYYYSSGLTERPPIGLGSFKVNLGRVMSEQNGAVGFSDCFYGGKNCRRRMYEENGLKGHFYVYGPPSVGVR